MEAKIRISTHLIGAFYGLKLNHPRAVAITHPLFFLLRRVSIIIAIALFVKQEYRLLSGLTTFIMTTLISLIFTAHEQPWKSGLVNHQSVISEMLIYSIALFAVCSRGNFADGASVLRNVDMLILAFVTTYLTLNAIILLSKLVHSIKLTYRRLHNKYIVAKRRKC